MKILITGGAGFIGGYLAQALAEDEQCTVHILDNFARGKQDAFLAELLARKNVSLLSIDMLDAAAMGKLDSDYTHIFHFAALLGVQNVLERPYDTLSLNVRLLEIAIALGKRQKALQRFVFASTSEVYAGSLLHMQMPVPTPENTPIALPDLAEPRTSYMLSKLYGEALVQHAGLPFTILRPHNIYGPRMGMAHVIPQLLHKAWKAKKGDEIEVFSPSHKRTFCYIDDAVNMILNAAGGEGGLNATLNLGNQEPEITIQELAEIILETVDKDVKIVWGEDTPGSPTRRCPHMGEMLERTDVAGIVSLEDGVQQCWEWYQPYFETLEEKAA